MRPSMLNILQYLCFFRYLKNATILHWNWNTGTLEMPQSALETGYCHYPQLEPWNTGNATIFSIFYPDHLSFSSQPPPRFVMSKNLVPPF